MKPIPGFDGYSIERAGRVFSHKTCKYLKPYSCSPRGYVGVKLRNKTGVWTNFYIHHLVAMTFLPPKPRDEMQLDHRDGDKSNNHVTNLRWATAGENQHNTIKSKDNKTGARGLLWDARIGRWRIRIQINLKQISGGQSFEKKDDAIAALKSLSKRLYGDFSPHTNP